MIAFNSAGFHYSVIARAQTIKLKNVSLTLLSVSIASLTCSGDETFVESNLQILVEISRPYTINVKGPAGNASSERAHRRVPKESFRNSFGGEFRSLARSSSQFFVKLGFVRPSLIPARLPDWTAGRILRKEDYRSDHYREFCA